MKRETTLDNGQTNFRSLHLTTYLIFVGYRFYVQVGLCSSNFFCKLGLTMPKLAVCAVFYVICFK